MGRPKSFEPDRVAHQIMETFWHKGFHATSLSDLESATGLNRKSLFLAFGNKAAMFRQSLDRYLEQKDQHDSGILFREPLGAHNIQAYFQTFSKGLERGCMLALAIMERESTPLTSYDEIQKAYQTLEEAFGWNLVPLLEMGVIGSQYELELLAKGFVNATLGLVVHIRLGLPQDDINVLVQAIINTIPN